jgi:glycosyltransferase involved in cell wall biosynthesis
MNYLEVPHSATLCHKSKSILANTKPRLLYIGTLPCEPIAGGPIQIYRHFVESNDFEFQSITESSDRAFPYLETGQAWVDRCIYRGGKTRLFPDLLTLNYLMAENREAKKLLPLAQAFQPQAIVTIAYGSYSFVAAAVARQMKLPLITFFHDWWPDLTPCRGWSKQWLDKRFRALYKETSLALCVCESMRKELGQHPNSVVLYPIPTVDGCTQSPPPQKHRERFQVTYLGTLEGDYGKLVQTLVPALKRNSETPFHLNLYGPAADWPEATLEDAQLAGLYGGKRYGIDAQTVLTEADALLVVMSFTQNQRRRVITSFPSKLLEYAAYGKPIVVWGPEECSAVQFLKTHAAGVVVTSSDPNDLIQCISRLAHDREWQAELCKAAQQLFASHFEPQRIHQQLLDSVQSLLAP